MRTGVAIFSIGLCLFLWAGLAHAPQVQAQDISLDAVPGSIDAERIAYERTPVNKLGRGAINVVTFWLEVPAEVYRVAHKKNAFIGSSLGFLQGICTGSLRLGTGILDMVTCFLPPYDQPLMEPEYAFDDVKKTSQEYLEETR